MYMVKVKTSEQEKNHKTHHQKVIDSNFYIRAVSQDSPFLMNVYGLIFFCQNFSASFLSATSIFCKFDFRKKLLIK